MKKYKIISDYQILSAIYEEYMHEAAENQDSKYLEINIDIEKISVTLNILPHIFEMRLRALSRMYEKNTGFKIAGDYINGWRVMWDHLESHLQILTEKEELHQIAKGSLRASKFAAIAAGLSAIAAIASIVLNILKGNNYAENTVNGCYHYLEFFKYLFCSS